MDPVNLIGKPSLLNLSETNLCHHTKMNLLVFSLSVGCTESSKELLKFGACLESGKLSEVLISWEKDEISVEERLDLINLLFEKTKYKPTLEIRTNAIITSD